MPRFRLTLEYTVDDPDSNYYEERKSWVSGGVSITDFIILHRYQPLTYETIPDSTLTFTWLPDPPEAAPPAEIPR